MWAAAIRRFRILCIVSTRLIGLFWPGRYGQQLPGMSDICGAAAAGEEPVMADTMEAFGQNMHHETADELMRDQRHGPVAARSFDTVILVFEGDAIGIGLDQPAV